MVKYALAAALVGVLGLSGTLFYVKAQNETLTTERDAALREVRAKDLVIQQRNEAAEVHRIYIQQAQEAADENAALLRGLQELEGRDAPLSDHMLDAAGRLFP